MKCLASLQTTFFARVALAASILWPSLSLGQTWQSITNAPPATPNAAFLLTDGTVIVQASPYSTTWLKLTPDQNGTYLNGTWSTIASLPAGYNPLYYASAVLPDGRFFMTGGEYNFIGTSDYSFTNLGAIYDPKSNTWTPVAPPTWAGGASDAKIGDAASLVLPNGKLLLTNPLSTELATLDPATLTWTSTSSTGKDNPYFDEEGLTLLPDGTILDVNVLYAPTNAAQRFLPSTGQWISAGTTPTSLLSANEEIGPAVLRPDGTVFATGASGATAVYTPPGTLTGTGSWVAGPTFPYISGLGQEVIADGPAALLPDGNVLVATSLNYSNPTSGPIHFYEFNGTSLTDVTPASGGPTSFSYQGHLLPLPNGQVLFVDAASTVQIYTPSGTANSAWAPTISYVPSTVGPGATYTIYGTQFNGLSQAVGYGDDYQAATNYPLVRITNQSTGHVFYARTHDHSTMAVATGGTTVSTNFDVPANIELGASTLVVVANGIPSSAVAITVATLKSSGTALGSSLNPSAGGQAVTFTATVTGAGGTPTGTVTFLDGIARIGTGTLNGSGVATFTTSSLIVGSHSITAAYSGDSAFGASTSTVVSQTVTGTSSTVTLSTNPNPSQYTQTLAMTATVTGTGGTPTGTVRFFDGSSWLASATLASGSASFDTSAPLAVGSHSISAQYSGDTAFAAATSNTVTQSIIPLTPVFGTMGFSPASSEPYGTSQAITIGDSLTYYASSIPTGTVTFTLNGIGYTASCTGSSSPRTCTATVSAATIAALPAASYTVTAAIAGDSTYAAATGASGTFTVTQSNLGAAATPTFSPAAGTYTSPQVVTLASTSAGAAIYYTTDGSTPTTASFLYTAPIAVTSSETINAIASGNGYTSSPAAGAAYVVNGVVGFISTVAGNGTVGSSGDGAAATSAEINYARGLAVDSNGNIYIADTYNSRIRKVTPQGIISTYAGTGTSGFSGDGGQATSAEISLPWNVGVDASNNLYIADTGNMRIRKVTPAGIISTVAGNGAAGFSGDGGQATSAELLYPYGVAADPYGNLYIDDYQNLRIRKVTAAGIISTIAGNGTAGYSGDNGAATSAELNYPNDVAVDGEGNVYIADERNNRVRRVTPSGIISTYAGTGSVGYNGDGEAATSANLNSPAGVTVDSSGNLYIADDGNLRIRKVSPAGTISTVVGKGVQGFTGDGGPATNAEINSDQNTALDASGNLYIADYSNQRIRKVTYQTAPNPIGYLDNAVDSVSGTTTVSKSDSLVVIGWVADAVDGAPLSNVKVYVDGSSIGTPTLGLSRPDVAAAYGNSAYTNSGFQLTYSAASLSVGPHSVTVVAIDSGARSTTFGSIAITVTGPPPFGYLDRAVDSVTGSTTVSQSDSLLVSGWAADVTDGAPLSNVKVYVDGTLFGTPTLGIARPDVAAAYSNSAYTNSGFQLLQAAASLSTGTHSVTVVAIDSGAHSTTFGPVAITVTPPPLPPPFGYLDLAADSVTYSTTVSQSDSLLVKGWVADATDGAPLSNVKVYVDGTSIGTPTLGLARADVAAAYGNSAYTNSGFQLLYSAASLSTGAHSVTVIAIDSGSRSTTFGPIAITVTPPPPPPPVGYLDRAVGNVSGSTTVSQTDSLLVSGWAADVTDGAPLSNVKVYVDGTLFGTPTLGISRPDVASAYGNSAYTNSGFQLLQSASSLSVGTHSVTVVAIDSGARSTTFGPATITVGP